MNYTNLKFRCSELGKIMTNGRGKDSMGKTCLTYLHELHLSLKYHRRKDFTSREMEKGIRMEEDAITLISLVHKFPFTKNKEQFSNDYLTGTPDVQERRDVKCCWSLWSMPKPGDELDKMYYWQNMGYMILTDSEDWTTDYCLVNAPGDMITREKERIWYALGCPGDDDEEYVKRLIELEKNMIFDIGQFRNDNPGYDMTCKVWEYDIPREERIVSYKVERDEQAIDALYSRIEECREYMQTTYGEKVAA